MRYAHTDIVVPDFSNYKKTSKPKEDSESSRKLFTYLFVAGMVKFYLKIDQVPIERFEGGVLS